MLLKLGIGTPAVGVPQTLPDDFWYLDVLFFEKLGMIIDGESMNTNDFESAIEYGATFVRVGTGIFGERN